MTVDKHRLSQAKTTAIVGFSVFNEQEQVFLSDRETNDEKKLRAVITDDLYKSFISSYAKKLNVKVLKPTELITNPYYLQMIKRYGTFDNQYRAHSVNYRNNKMLTAAAFFKMTPQEKLELAKALRVDSILGVESMIYETRSHNSTFTIFNIEKNSKRYSYNYRATLTELELYDQLSAKPIVVVKNLISSSTEQYDKQHYDNRIESKKEDGQAMILAMDLMVDKLTDEMLNGSSK
ncbi:hypothetical protein RI844_17715 [Thalassotalea fonticola]|uniref:Uncharacterized protein n=1 Tax=Thalassotalea fonticola TaxID=3065649 RepID=A0ABZ0GNG8_9GAMM|nr:hypothetical protein RI844_17715 [Colwelliaceae bacterium S1-1]